MCHLLFCSLRILSPSDTPSLTSTAFASFLLSAPPSPFRGGGVLYHRSNLDNRMCTFCIYIRCQPRIVCYDPQRETRGWDGPGAYEWDERPDHTDCHTEGTTDGANATLAAPAAPATATEDGGYGTGRTTRGKPSALKGSRPRGMSVRDPERASPVFREGSSEFTSPCHCLLYTSPSPRDRG